MEKIQELEVLCNNQPSIINYYNYALNMHRNATSQNDLSIVECNLKSLQKIFL